MLLLDLFKEICQYPGSLINVVNVTCITMVMRSIIHLHETKSTVVVTKPRLISMSDKIKVLQISIQ